MTSIEEELAHQLEDAQEGLHGAEESYANAVTRQLEAKAALDVATRTVRALERALREIRGEEPLPQPEGPPKGPTGPETATYGEAEYNVGEWSTPRATFAHRSDPEEIEDPRERKERRREVEEAARRLAESDKSKPKCRGCGRHGTLQMVQHPSGVNIQMCTACGNQAVLG